jgi:hypothetical protein
MPDESQQVSGPKCSGTDLGQDWLERRKAPFSSLIHSNHTAATRVSTGGMNA